MIFKTFRQNLEDVYIAGRKINELNNLKLNATNITSYTTALKGLNAKQAELVLSTQGLTFEQQQAVLAEMARITSTGKLTTAQMTEILVSEGKSKADAKALLINTGLITSETAEATATNIVTAAKLRELVATGKLTQAEANLIAAKAGVTLATQKESTSLLAGIGSKIKGAGTALKGLGTGILTIAQAHPVIAGITAALALCGGAALVNKIKQEKAAKAIKEAYKNAKTAIDDINNTFNEKSSKTKEIAKEYAELAQGVNLLTNENKNLSTEKYERFLELSKQLSTLYPSLTKNFDENGNAILDLSGDVDTIVGSLDDLIERQRVLADQEIVKQMPDLFAGYSNNVADLEEQKEDAKKTRDEIQKAYDVLNSWDGSTVWWANGGQVVKGADNAVRSLSDYTNALDILGIKYKQVAVDLDNDVYHNNDGYSIEADYKKYGNELHDIYVDRINKATDEVKYAEQQFEAETSSINQYLNTWLQTEFSYNQIKDTGLQKAIQEILFNFKWTNISKDKRGDWNYVSEYLRRNILFEINKAQNDPVISKAFSEVLTNAELTPNEKANYLQQIQDYFGEDNIITISLKPQIDDAETLQKQYQQAIKDAKKIQGDFDWDSWFKENSINTQEEIDRWKEIVQSANNAAEARKKYMDAPSNDNNQKQSFSESWDSIGTTGTDEENKKLLEEKYRILELAEAGKLTKKELEKSSLAEIFEKSGVSIEEATKKINEMKSSASQLASMKTGISSISSILGEKKENLSSKETRTVGIGADTLDGMPEDVKAQTKEYINFIKVLGNGTSTMEECKDAANKLATAYVTNNNFLANLTDETGKCDEKTKDYYTSLLKEMGVKNAAKVVDDAVTASKQVHKLKTDALAAATKDLADGTSDATDKFYENNEAILGEKRAITLTKIEMFDLIAKEKIFSNIDLSTEQKIKEVNKLAESYFGVSTAIDIAQSAMVGDWRYYPDEESKQKAKEKREKEAQKNYEKWLKKLRRTAVDVDASPKTKSKDSSKKSKSTPAKTEINWLERRFTNMQNIIDLTKSKLQNLFSVDDRQNNISEQIKQTTKQIKQYEIAADRYMKKAEKVAKASTVKEDGKKKKVPALSKDIIEKIQSGEITKESYSKFVKKYDKNYADKINAYIDYYDKSQNAEKSAEEKRAEKRQLKKDKIQVKIDDYESSVSLLEQQKENATTAPEKLKYLEQEKGIYDNIYQQKIKNAELDEDAVEIQRLQEEQNAKKKELENEAHQNNIDEMETSLDLLSALKENAKTADGKIHLTDQELAITKQIYSKKKAMADSEEEKDRLDIEYKAKEKQAQIDKANYIKDEYDTKLNALERDKSDTDARIKKNEALGVGQSRADYKEQIELSKNRRKILEDEKDSLERYLAEQIEAGNIVANENDPAYKALRDSISECTAGISDCITEQIEFNKAIDNMDLENYKSLISLLEKGNNIYKRFKSLADVHGSTLSDDNLFEQIGINDKIINGYEGLNAELEDDIKEYLKDPEKKLGLMDEQIDKIVDIAKNSPENLAAYMESLGIEDFNEKHFPELFENINAIQDNLDAIYQTRVENENLIDEYFDKHISKINDYLDALKKEKDIKDRTLAIEKAQFDLNKAKNNLTKKVWDGSQWVYTSDTEAVQSAQEAFDNAQYEELVNVLEDLTEALEKFKTEELNLYDDYGNQINTLDDAKAKASPYLDVIDKLFGDKGMDAGTPDREKVLDSILSSSQLSYNLPENTVPNFSTTSVQNPMNISKIELILPNVTDNSTATDLTKDFLNELSCLKTYAAQYNWNK